MDSENESDIFGIYDWNTHQSSHRPSKIIINDETLRDGLQSPSTRDPHISGKLRLVRLMERLGVHTADVGYPSSSPKMYSDVKQICEMIRDEGLRIQPNCAARTHEYDIKPVIEISHDVGIPVEVCAFLGTSVIRQLVEGWDMERLENLARSAVRLCVENDVPVMFVTEDTTRSRPEDIKHIYLAAVHEGAQAVCISDTVGHASPEGAYALSKFVREFLDDEGYKDVRIDWHGHRDRGLSVSNSLAALRGGAERIHGTGLGVGERCGNTPLDQLLVNLKLLGWIDNDLSSLAEYTHLVSELVGIPIPVNYPVIGKDAFKTATGVHAAALVKAQKMGLDWCNNVYSGVNAADYGRNQSIEIGPMSGKSNVLLKLQSMGLEYSDDCADKLLEMAKRTGQILTDEEIREAVCRPERLAY